MRPGTYLAITQVTIELCLGTLTEATVVESTTYEPGDEFTIPRHVNSYFSRPMQPTGLFPDRDVPEPRYRRRVDLAESR